MLAKSEKIFKHVKNVNIKPKSKPTAAVAIARIITDGALNANEFCAASVFLFFVRKKQPTKLAAIRIAQATSCCQLSPRKSTALLSIFIIDSVRLKIPPAEEP